MISSFSSLGMIQRKAGGGAVVDNGLWVAVGNGGNSIAYSTNGTTWTTADSSGGITNGSGIAYGNGQWVAVGDGSVIATSTNETSWTTVPTANIGGLTSGFGVAYSNGRWIAVGFGSQRQWSTNGFTGTNPIAYSTNGTSWTQADSSGGIFKGYRVAYGNGRWVAVGGNYGKLIAYSTDNGTSWTAVPDANCGGITDEGRGVAYGNGRWVVVGYGSKIAYSTDGINWTAASSVGGIGAALGVAYFNGLWVATGGSSIVYSTNNGINWIAVDADKRGGITGAWDVAYGNGRWVVVGFGSKIAYSTDGINWTAVDADKRGGLNYGSDVAYRPPVTFGKWVVVGNGSSIATSINGRDWTAVDADKRGGITYGIAVASDNVNTWFALGGTSVVKSTGNGNTWSSILNYGFKRCVAYGNGIWIVGGTVDNNTYLTRYIISYSAWSNVQQSFTFSPNQIAYDGIGKWIVVGSGSQLMYYSITNGQSWVLVQAYGDLMSGELNIGGISSIFEIAYGNGRWVAGGVKSTSGTGIAYSSDGINWYQSNAGGLTGIGGLAYGKNDTGDELWVAVGTGSKIVTSKNGMGWSPANSVGGLLTGRGVTYGRDNTGTGLWVAVGGTDGSVIVTSRNGTDWSAANSLGGITAGLGVAFIP